MRRRNPTRRAGFAFLGLLLLLAPAATVTADDDGDRDSGDSSDGGATSKAAKQAAKAEAKAAKTESKSAEKAAKAEAKAATTHSQPSISAAPAVDRAASAPTSAVAQAAPPAAAAPSHSPAASGDAAPVAAAPTAATPTPRAEPSNVAPIATANEPATDAPVATSAGAPKTPSSEPPAVDIGAAPVDAVQMSPNAGLATPAESTAASVNSDILAAPPPSVVPVANPAAQILEPATVPAPPAVSPAALPPAPSSAPGGGSGTRMIHAIAPLVFQSNPTGQDSDGDGLTDAYEQSIGTNPYNDQSPGAEPYAVHAVRDGDSVIVTWRAIPTPDVASFLIARADGEPLGTVTATGAREYAARDDAPGDTLQYHVSAIVTTATGAVPTFSPMDGNAMSATDAPTASAVAFTMFVTLAAALAAAFGAGWSVSNIRRRADKQVKQSLPIEALEEVSRWTVLGNPLTAPRPPPAPPPRRPDRPRSSPP